MSSSLERGTALFLALALAIASPASAITLQSLQTKLGAKKKSWVAGPTSVSALSDQEVKRMLGLQLPKDNGVVFSTSKSAKGGFPFPFPFPLPWDDEDDNKDLPKSLDWRNKDGVNFSAPIMDQGRCGSCVAFAVVAALETQMNISRETPFSPWAFSPQHLFSCGGGGCETGWQPASALSYLEQNGIPDEQCFPYESGVRGDDISCKKSCSDASSRSEKISGYGTEASFFKSNSKLKAALQNGPLVATMIVYEDFIYYKGGVYEHTDGKQLGGHAVTIEGYDDTDNAFIVRNSWGPDWGEAGYFRIKYDDESQIGASSYSIQVGKGEGVVTAKGLRNYTVLSGKLALDLFSSYPDTTRINYSVLQNGAVQVADGHVATNSSTDLDTNALPDGAYEIKPSAETKKGTMSGDGKIVYVLNGKLNGTIKFDNISAGDEITGDKTVELRIDSKPIVPTELTFFFKEVKTGEEYHRTTTNVGPSMTLNWRTGPRNKGDYEIRVVAKAGSQELKSDVLKVALK